MSKQKQILWSKGPYKIITGQHNLPVIDEETKQVLLFATIEDCVEAIHALGFAYWDAGAPRPDNAAYEQLETSHK